MSIRSFAQLLKFGLANLADFRDTGNSGITGIEDHLNESYFNDMYEINHYTRSKAPIVQIRLIPVL
jgi:hypothetical protein